MREEMNDFLDEIISNVDHGECFYDSESFNDLCITIDLFKSSCKDLFENNQE